MEQLVIIADLGRLRAFHLGQEDPLAGGPVRAREIDVPSLDQQPEPLSETVTDQAGRFARGNGAGNMGGMSRGEAHELQSELEKRLIQGLAEKIDAVVGRHGSGRWILAAPTAICQRLESALPPKTKDRLSRVEKADLTKLSVKDIEKRFVPGT